MAVGRSIIRRSDTAEVPGLAGVFILAVPMKGYLRNGPGRPQIGGRLFGTPRRSARSRFRFAECRRQIPSYRVAPENPKNLTALWTSRTVTQIYSQGRSCP